MVRLLITGKDSFVGESVREYLSAFPDGFSIDVIDVRGDAWRNADFSGYDSVLHVAGIAHVSCTPDMESLYRSVNRDLAIAVAEKAKASGVRQFILMSSMIVYGEAAPVGVRSLIGPGTPEKPVNAYGQSKLDAETGVRALEDGHFHAAILRPPMIYGKGCKGNYRMLRKMCALPVFPSLGNARSALYIGNLCEFLRQLIAEGCGGTFWPRNRETVSTADFIRAMAPVLGRRVWCTRVFDPFLKLLGKRGVIRRAFGDMAYSADMPDWPGDYRICGFEESVRRTESRS